MRTDQLKRTREISTVAEAEAFYDAWAGGYERELKRNGYTTPHRCATILAAHADDLDAPVLDVGCGTGLGGLALQAEGFSTLDGYDLSPEMLQYADEKDIYRQTGTVDISQPLDHFSGQNYQSIVAVGVFNPRFLSPMVLDAIMGLLATGGRFVFSLNEHALAESSFTTRILEWTELMRAELLVKEYGPHIPGMDLMSTVYLLRKC